MTKTYQVHAIKAGKYWELHIEGEGVTQVRSLRKAPSMVRDWLTTMYDRDYSNAPVELSFDLGGFEAEVAETRKAIADAASAQKAAAERSRRLTSTLQGKGLTGSDVAAILGVTPGRVSQLSRA